MHACGPRACIQPIYSVAPHVARRPEPLASPPDTSSYHHSPHMNISVPCQRSSLSLSRSLYSPTYGCRAPICSTPRRSMSPSPLSMRVPQRAYSARGGYGAGESVRGAAPSSARRDLAHTPRVSASTHVSALKSARHTRATRAPHIRSSSSTAAVCRLCTSSPLVPPQCTGLSVCAASPDWPFDWPMPGSAGSLLVRLVLMGASRCGRRIGWGPPPRPEPPNG